MKMTLPFTEEILEPFNNKFMENSNYTKLQNLIDILDPVEAVFMVERLLKIAELTKASIKTEPEKWKNGFINPVLYVNFCNKIEDYFSVDLSRLKLDEDA